MIDKKQLAIFGSNNLLEWMQESMNQIKKEFENIYKEGMSVFHINTQDIDSFKKSVEAYAKDHPNASIQAAGFMISTEEPSKNKEFKFTTKPKKKKRRKK